MKTFSVGIICLAFCACAPTQFLKKNYQPAQLESKSILIYPVFPDRISVINTNDFSDDFEDVATEPGDFFKGEISDGAAKYFGAKFKKVTLENAEDSVFEALNGENSTKLSEKIGKDDFEARIPKLEYLEKRNVKPKFVLVMDQIIFDRNLETYQHANPVSQPGTINVGGKTMNTPGTTTGFVTTSKKSIAVGINYAIYDYEENALVGYGFAKGEKTFQFAMTRSDWYAAMDDAYGKIRKFTPFQ